MVGGQVGCGLGCLGGLRGSPPASFLVTVLSEDGVTGNVWEEMCGESHVSHNPTTGVVFLMYCLSSCVFLMMDLEFHRRRVRSINGRIGTERTEGQARD